jgi:DNA-binding transcriptional LysR family regulator
MNAARPSLPPTGRSGRRTARRLRDRRGRAWHEPSAVSHAIKTVEDGLGLPLFARTTRSVSLTEAGTSFIASIAPAITAIEEAGERVTAAKGTVGGLLRLNVPRLALRFAMTPIMAEMAWRYPDLTIEITCDDRLVDIVADGFDAGIRLGEMIAEDMIAVRLTPPFKAILVASPSYLKAKGEPRCSPICHTTTASAFVWLPPAASMPGNCGTTRVPKCRCRCVARRRRPTRSTSLTLRLPAWASPMFSSRWCGQKFADGSCAG